MPQIMITHLGIIKLWKTYSGQRWYKKKSTEIFLQITRENSIWTGINAQKNHQTYKTRRQHIMQYSFKGAWSILRSDTQ